MDSFICERLTFTVRPGSVDRANHLVRGVRVIGPRSRNGRKYPPAITAASLALYDGVPVHLGHHFDPVTKQPTEVPPQDKFGRIVAPYVHENGVSANLSYNPKHPFAETFLWAAENAPGLYAFSVLQQVTWRPHLDADGDRVAESILGVASVDIVTDGGTTSNIFESLDPARRGALPVVAESAHAARLRSVVADLCTGSAPTAQSAPPRHVSAADLVASFEPSGSNWRG